MSFIFAKSKYLISVQGNFKLPLQLNNSSTKLSCQTHISKGKEKLYGIYTEYFLLCLWSRLRQGLPWLCVACAQRITGYQYVCN